MTVTHTLAQMATDDFGQTITDDALHVMRLSVLDWAACAIAGRDEPVSKAVRQLELENAGAPVATVVGTTTKLPMRGAAMVNGTTAHAMDFDDTHFAHIGHPSAVIVSAALAMAQHHGAVNGDKFLRATLIGAEASVRVGLWLGRPHYEVGFHQTATAGTIGAAVAGAVIFDLPMDQTHSAIGLAATRAAGLKVQFGTMGKPYHAGMAAASAVEAVHAAMSGLEGAPEVLDGPFGYGATHHGIGDTTAFEQPALLFEAVSHKYHACCHGTHASIEALLSLAGSTPIDDIKKVDIKVHPRWLDVCAIASPQTRLEAKFSLSLTAALALMGQALDTDVAFEPEVILSDAVVALRDKVIVTGDAKLSDTQAYVAISSDGKTVEAAHDLAAIAPLQDREVRVRKKAVALVGVEREARLWAAIEGDFDVAAFANALTQK